MNNPEGQSPPGTGKNGSTSGMPALFSPGINLSWLMAATAPVSRINSCATFRKIMFLVYNPAGGSGLLSLSFHSRDGLFVVRRPAHALLW